MPAKPPYVRLIDHSLARGPLGSSHKWNALSFRVRSVRGLVAMLDIVTRLKNEFPFQLSFGWLMMLRSRSPSSPDVRSALADALDGVSGREETSRHSVVFDGFTTRPVTLFPWLSRAPDSIAPSLSGRISGKPLLAHRCGRSLYPRHLSRAISLIIGFRDAVWIARRVVWALAYVRARGSRNRRGPRFLWGDFGRQDEPMSGSRDSEPTPKDLRLVYAALIWYR